MEDFDTQIYHLTLISCFLGLYFLQAYSIILITILGIGFLLIVVNNKKYTHLKEFLSSYF